MKGDSAYGHFVSVNLLIDEVDFLIQAEVVSMLIY